jgi:F420-dependent methylenetetrahydromethanopterin dehydrogenase
MKSEDVAFARLAAIGMSPAEKARLDEINKSIDITMAQVIRDAKYNPNALDAPMTKVTPVGAPVVKEPGVPLLPGVAASRPILWDHIRLGARPEPKAEEKSD